MVEDLRENQNMPFDELYHKEKMLIQNVIEADLALKKKMEALPNPLPEKYSSP